MSPQYNDPMSPRSRFQGIPWKAVVRFLVSVVLLTAVPFVAAGRLDWWEGWAYVLLTVLAIVGSRVLVFRFNPDLAVERATSMQSEDVRWWDRWIVPIVGVFGPLITIGVGGLDVRFAWSPPTPLWLRLAGLVLLASGSALATWAMVSNRFFSAVVRIQSDRGQTVVTSGPYRMVRHPGYAGGIVASLATPLLFGSLWAWIPAGVSAALIVLRTELEDRVLQAELPGYAEYAQRTPYRLLPWVW